jgi:hypothetical protein
MVNRIEALRAIVGEYEDERSLTASRLDKYELRRGQLELARELLVEHGQKAAADSLNPQLHELDHHVQASRAMLDRLDGLIAMYRSSLQRIEQSAKQP